MKKPLIQKLIPFEPSSRTILTMLWLVVLAFILLKMQLHLNAVAELAETEIVQSAVGDGFYVWYAVLGAQFIIAACAVFCSIVDDIYIFQVMESAKEAAKLENIRLLKKALNQHESTSKAEA